MDSGVRGDGDGRFPAGPREPPEPPDPLGPFTHLALLYRDEREYLDGVLPFVRGALAAGEPVIVAVPAERLRLIQDEFGTDPAPRLVDMRVAGRNPGRIIPGVLRAFADTQPPGAQVRIVGEPMWAERTAVEYAACVQHEALVNLSFEGRRATVLCPYDIRALAPQAVADVHATHPMILDAGSGRARDSDSYAPDAALARYNEPLPPVPDVLALAFDAEALGETRHLATDEGARLGLPSARLPDLALAIAELTTNSVVHGGGSGALRLWAEDGFVVCEVRDKGHLTDPLAGRRPAPRARRGGRGLLLVNLLADLVRLHTGPGGTTVRCWFRR
ncbi:anti-sigma factor RsbA family regulatory protein [Streptomyces sp. NPDC092369]|uniref:anti-sigma factor RsbA family regulatory protein n=1 Tax=Streptomyces sp. NPDC092369 TaxID=3366015 RepID=UPI003807A3AA